VVPGNTKLGPKIFSWSVTPGAKHSCPKETETCRALCYAKHGFFLMRSTAEAHKRNLTMSKRATFAPKMIAYLKTSRVTCVRIHAAGDFYDVHYIRKWHQIMSALPNIQFYAYTRSWQDAVMLRSLVRLTQLPNFKLWYSCDRSSGRPPVTYRVNWAYLAVDDLDKPDYACDLIFRARRNTVHKRINGVLVCPVENGVAAKSKITCTTCGVCWDNKKLHALERKMSFEC